MFTFAISSSDEFLVQNGRQKWSSAGANNVIKFFFSYRVVSEWNMLNEDILNAMIAHGFKTKLETERTCEEDGSISGLKSAGPRSPRPPRSGSSRECSEVFGF